MLTTQYAFAPDFKGAHPPHLLECRWNLLRTIFTTRVINEVCVGGSALMCVFRGALSVPACVNAASAARSIACNLAV